MEDIKVGDYVRTKKYGIARVDDIKHCIWLDRAIAADPCVPSHCFTIEEYKNIVKKHSSNIIDLIEAGDYVNGEKVENIEGFDKNGNDTMELGVIENDLDYAYGVFLTDLNIRTIVTKEQFANAEYRLEN